MSNYFGMSLTSFSRISLSSNDGQLGSHSCSSSLLAGSLCRALLTDLVGPVQKSSNTTLSGLLGSSEKNCLRAAGSEKKAVGSEKNQLK